MRYTAKLDEEVVVFIIGMKVNNWLAVHRYGPVFKAMPPMIRELSVNKELGCLSMESYFGLRTTLMVQYWRSTEELLAYARGKTHAKAWQTFNKKCRNNTAVGIYHETYVIPKGSYESVYVNIDPFGLSKALGIEEMKNPLAPSGAARFEHVEGKD
ncbi:DUF4188 domain-containing protein [Alteribacter aurantiacus]|uniref:DUF4188 domain-containing protein n=1 Tax=Alteribacter aurantiacus TaxID=254410 RepID=UPI00041B2BAD|nr:DUF4188 domain-containing protein [Alteribacter aurantiacus]